MNYEPWFGCYKESTGCDNCYFYGNGAKYQEHSRLVKKTDKFYWPVQKDKDGKYRIKGGKKLPTCFSTDFFLPEADEWRKDVWKIIKERQDIEFLILTKRIDRFFVSLPEDWNDGYPNVTIGCTVENQEMADKRLPILLSLPIKKKFISCSPLLSPIDLLKYLHGVYHVTVGGETSRNARECDLSWVLDIHKQCLSAGITFWFKNTGSLFKVNGETQKVNPFKQMSYAKEFGLNIIGDEPLF